MNYYNHFPVGKHTIVLTEIFPNEARGHAMGLITGTESAVVIDTSWGVIGNLREYVESITPLPVTCLLTHPHPDHVGASVLFDQICMSRLDNSILSWALTPEKRLLDAGGRHQDDPKLLEAMRRGITDCSNFSYTNIQDGDIFDLGGATVEAILVPGHTAGSMTFYCKQDDILFGGDTIGPMVTLTNEGKEPLIPIETYRDALKKLKSKITDQTQIVHGHSSKPLTADFVDDLLEACHHMLSGEGGNQTLDRTKLPLSMQSKPNLCFAAAGKVCIAYEKK